MPHAHDRIHPADIAGGFDMARAGHLRLCAGLGDGRDLNARRVVCSLINRADDGEECMGGGMRATQGRVRHTRLAKVVVWP